MCYLKLRSYQAAEAILRRGAAEHHTKRGADYQRSTTLEYARLALAQLGQSNVTDSANTGVSVLVTATDGVLSPRTLKVVRLLAGGMASYARLPVVQSFFDQLETVAK